MATLVFKLFSLTLKTISKPIASRLNGVLLTHPVVRQRLVKVANVSVSLLILTELHFEYLAAKVDGRLVSRI